MFPTVDGLAAWEVVRRDDDALRAGVTAICRRHGLDPSDVARLPGGSLPVYAVGDALTPSARDRLATELGAAVAALHALDVAPLGALAADWGAFLDAQRATAVERQRARGLDRRWLEQIPAFLDAWAPPAAGPRALLHTELMREHLLVVPAPHGWALSGLFDFEPATVGAPEYDLASFGLFVSCGDGRFLRRALLAYGYDERALDGALQRRLLAYALLHRYSNLRWYLERLPAPGIDSLDALAARWWSLDPS